MICTHKNRYQKGICLLLIILSGYSFAKWDCEFCNETNNDLDDQCINSGKCKHLPQAFKRAKLTHQE